MHPISSLPLPDEVEDLINLSLHSPVRLFIDRNTQVRKSKRTLWVCVGMCVCVCVLFLFQPLLFVPVILFFSPTQVTSRLVQEFVRIRPTREDDREAIALALLTRTYKSRVVVRHWAKKKKKRVNE